MNYKGQFNRYSDGLRAERTGFDFSLLHSVQVGSGAHPASYRMGTGGFSHGVKRPWREGDNSSLPSVEVKNCGAIPPLPNPSSWRGT
jgi:hypothetical protein